MHDMHGMEVAATGPLDVLLWVSGILIVLLILRVLAQPSAWDEKPKYDMLGLEPPAPQEREHGEQSEALHGKVGTEDRIVRFGVGFTIAYVGLTSGKPLTMLISGLCAAYVLLTFALGQDPLYRRFGIHTVLTK